MSDVLQKRIKSSLEISGTGHPPGHLPAAGVPGTDTVEGRAVWEGRGDSSEMCSRFQEENRRAEPRSGVGGSDLAGSHR